MLETSFDEMIVGYAEEKKTQIIATKTMRRRSHKLIIKLRYARRVRSLSIDVIYENLENHHDTPFKNKLALTLNNDSR
jgi:hypothetical protein